jgi:hypothetical protein
MPCPKGSTSIELGMTSSLSGIFFICESQVVTCIALFDHSSSLRLIHVIMSVPGFMTTPLHTLHSCRMNLVAGVAMNTKINNKMDMRIYTGSGH